MTIKLVSDKKIAVMSSVRYRMKRVNVHGWDRTGCSSEDFLWPGQSIVTLDHLLSRVLGKPLRDALARFLSDKKRIAFLAENTGLREFPQYLTLLFEIDGLFLNDDRHLNNITVLEQGDGTAIALSLTTARGFCPTPSSLLWISPRRLS